ncbi:MAG TPA: phosphoribosyltransferase [Opitutus sp.]|nr:phosphoribosyltransferase [Opitutus sp.]
MSPARRYQDRLDAGRALARLLAPRAFASDPIVLALPRGGVPVGLEIARVLHAPLDVFLVRKLGHPQQEELAIGAIASCGVRLLDAPLIAEEAIPPAQVDAITAREFAELNRREMLYRGGRPPLEISGHDVILVDDGIATGYSIRVAVLALEGLSPARIAIAAPVGAPDTCDALARDVDALVCPLQPSPFHAVGLWYEHFPTVTDDEVRAGLAQAAQLIRR